MAYRVPDSWLSGVTFALTQLAGLKSGEARLESLNVSVTGDANTPASYRAIKTALQSGLPRGVRLGSDRVTAPVVSPFTWAARHGGGQVVLSGYVSGDKTRDDIVTAARSALPRANVVDRMEVAEGAPASWTGVAIAALKELGRLEEGSAETRDAQLTVAGMAADEAIADTARRNMRSAMPQGFRMTDQIQHRAPPPPPIAVPSAPSLPKVAGPYVTTAAVNAGSVVLTGFAPSDTARDAIVQQAKVRFPGRQIDNRLEIAPGAPDGWQRCVDGGLLGIARLGSGRLQLSDRRLEVAGATEDDDLAEAVPADVRAAVRGDCDANVRVDILAETAPELVWRAVYSGADVILEGDVPSAAARAQLVQSAGRKFRGAAVVDRMRVVETRTRKWPRVADAGLTMLADLKRGEVRLNRLELVVAGEAADQQVITSIRERINRDLQKGYTGRDQVSVGIAAPPRAPIQPPPSQPVAAAPRPDTAKVCQDGLRSAASEGLIRFARASADIERASFPTLDKLAGIARACPQVVIEIEGHTDAEGTPERKQRLSDRRARSVVDYLNKAGVDGNKMQAVGYADTRPLAPNDTSDNRARNRRIEFTVKTN